ncbi:MAG: hypothetical protein ACFFED_06290 [Candidatus Thorarchaeota archaeon]
MEIPVLTRFIEGLKLFFESKRLKWLTLIFFVGAAAIYLMERLISWVPGAAMFFLAVSAIFPFFWMLTTFVALLGFQRFIASEETYSRSAILAVIWIIVSTVLFIVSFFFVWGLLLAIVFLGFFVWIGFQGYFSTRTSLGLASGVQIEHRSKAMTFLFGLANIFNYAILVGAIIGTIIFIGFSSWVAVGLAAIGAGIAAFFNFINGLIITRERNRQTADNLTLLGLFIALYSGYFIYNVIKPLDLSARDIVGLLVTIFFLLYTMSGVGRSLASRAEMESRFKLSKELAATFTFFIASCYVFVDVMFTLLLTNAGVAPEQIAPLSDVLKLWLFPLIALVVEIRFVWRSRKVTEAPETPDDIPVVPIEETVSDEKGEVIEETTHEVEEVTEEPEEDIPEEDDSYGVGDPEDDDI